MGEVTPWTRPVKHEDEWLEEAHGGGHRRSPADRAGSPPLMNSPVGRLNERQWGWIVTAAIFGWIEARTRKRSAKVATPRNAFTTPGSLPIPGDVAVVRSILPSSPTRPASTGPSRWPPGPRRR